MSEQCYMAGSRGVAGEKERKLLQLAELIENKNGKCQSLQTGQSNQGTACSADTPLTRDAQQSMEHRPRKQMSLSRSLNPQALHMEKTWRHEARRRRIWVIAFKCVKGCQSFLCFFFNFFFLGLRLCCEVLDREPIQSFLGTPVSAPQPTWSTVHRTLQDTACSLGWRPARGLGNNTELTNQNG